MAEFVVVAEKPSVAKRIRAALRGEPVAVTSVRGHVLETDFPSGYGWGQVAPRRLFDVRNFVLKVRDRRSYRELVSVFERNRGAALVVATDNDAEGELIGLEIARIWGRVAGKGKVLRMRFNSTDAGELGRAWRRLEDGLNWRWVEKAMFRDRFDLVTGAAFTRLLTLATRRLERSAGLISWGPCQSPTLNFLVQREREILSFKPEKFWVIKAVLEAGGVEFVAESERYKDRKEAAADLRAARFSPCVVMSYSEREVRVRRPLPARTDDLLRDLVKITGLSASKLLKVAEDLYADGYISYPRTETNRYRHGFKFARAAWAAARGLGVPAPEGKPRPRNGTLDDGAHDPIHPVAPFKGGGVAGKVWEYVARRFLANAFYGDAVLVEQSAAFRAGPVELKASGRYVAEEGFFSVFGYFRPRDEPLPMLREGEEVRVLSLELEERETEPPPRLTEAELLAKMEKAGIGTDATRAEYPKLVVERGYAVKAGRVLKPTALGMALIGALESVDPALVTPETRRRAEELMARIERGELSCRRALEVALPLYRELFAKCELRVAEIAAELAAALRASAKLARRRRAEGRPRRKRRRGRRGHPRRYRH